MSLGAEWYAQIPHAATFWSFDGLLSVQCLRLCLCPPVVVKFLLHKKCDTRVVNNWGKTGLDYATERHHDHVVRVLEMQGAPRGEVRVKTPPKVERVAWMWQRDGALRSMDAARRPWPTRPP